MRVRVKIHLQSLEPLRLFLNNIDVVAFPGEPETCGVANRIEISEELLVDYRSFDVRDAKSDEKYLKS